MSSMSLSPTNEEIVLERGDALVESSSSAPPSIIPVFATMKKGVSSVSVSSGSAHSGSAANLTRSHGGMGTSGDKVGDGGTGHSVRTTRLATMCPTVPGHIVPPKSQKATPARPPQYNRVSTATSAQRSTLRVQANNAANVNNGSSRPSSAIPTATTQSSTGGSRASSAGTKRDGRGFSNMSSLSKLGPKKSHALVPNPKSCSSSSSSASSLTIQQSQQPTSVILSSTKIQSSIIDELGRGTHPPSNLRLYQRANSQKEETSTGAVSKLTRLRKTQRSNSTTAIAPVIPAKNQNNQTPPLHVSTTRRRNNSTATAASHSQNENNHQIGKINSGTKMTSSGSNNHLSSASNLHHNNNNGSASHSTEALKNGVGSTNGSNANGGGMTTRSKTATPRVKNEELLRNTLADIERERQSHAEEISSLVNRHETEISETNSKWEAQISTLKEVHLQEVKELSQNHRFEIDKVKILLNREIATKVEKVSQLENRLEGLVLELERERECHREEIQTLIEKHDREIQTLNQRIDTLKQSHELQLEEIAKNRQSQIDHLEREHRSKIETLKRKHEEKLEQQMKQVPDNILKKEIDSLEVVLQLKNQELKEMRKELLEFKTKNDELGFLYEQNKVLHARVEDLEAQIEKTRTDKKTILEKYNVMETSMHQVINENDRLHLNNEQLSYKIEMMQTSDISFAMSETSEGELGNPSLPE